MLSQEEFLRDKQTTNAIYTCHRTAYGCFVWTRGKTGQGTVVIDSSSPWLAAGYYNAPTLEQEVDDQVKQIRPFLEYFGQYLLSETVVEVDDDDRKDTSELVKERLPNGYRKVRCRLTGDLIFQGGQFSVESGSWDDDSPMNCRDIVSDWNSD